MFPRTHPSVNVQVTIAFLCELFATIIAREGPRSGVGASMSDCRRQSREGALADEARHAKIESACNFA